LEGALGASVLIDGSLSCASRTLFVLFFVVAVLALATAALFALFGVLLPQDYPALDDEQIRAMATEEEMKSPPNQVRERLLTTLCGIIVETREANDSKARALHWTAISLGIGLVAIAAQAISLPFA
jgi:hypothetical protein